MTTVLQIIPSMGAGGAEQATIDVAEGLIAAGHQAIVVSSGGVMVRQLEQVGARHITQPMNSKNPFIMTRNAQWLQRFIHEQKVDIAHVRSRAPAWSTYLACRQASCGFMTTFHAAYKYKSPLKNFIIVLWFAATLSSRSQNLLLSTLKRTTTYRRKRSVS